MPVLNDIIVKTVQLMPRSFVKLFADRYIAGETLSEAENLVKILNSKNIMATIDVLGEDTNNREEADSAKNEAIKVINSIHKESLSSSLSVKLTQIGLKIDKELCYENLKTILKTAKENNIYVEIDMEDSSCTDDTLEIYYRSRQEFDNVGMVIQAYMRRSESDITKAIDILKNSSVRLCKGIYNEPEKIAFKSKQEIRDNYVKLLDLLLSRKIYVGIATHDIYLINSAKELINKYQLKKDEYEFQMLLGVKVDLRDKLVQENNRLRVYVPFGPHWFKYSLRRMKENPELVKSIITNIFAKK